MNNLNETFSELNKIWDTADTKLKLKESHMEFPFDVEGFKWITNKSGPKKDGATQFHLTYKKDETPIVKIETWNTENSPVTILNNYCDEKAFKNSYSSFEEFAKDLKAAKC